MTPSGRPSCPSKCELQTAETQHKTAVTWHSQVCCLRFSMKNLMVLKKGPVSRKSIIVIPENHEYLKYLKMFTCFPVWTVSQGNPLFLKYVSRLDKPLQRVTWAISYVTSCIHKKRTSYTGADCHSHWRFKLKIVQPLRLKTRSSFLYPSAMCLLNVWTRINELSLVFGR